MSWRARPVLTMELRGGLEHSDDVLGHTCVLPKLPWSDDDYQSVRYIAVGMIKEILQIVEKNTRE